MPQLKELLQSHLAQKDISLRTFAERTGISYPTILALLSRGHAPRKPEHRESLRRELGLDQEAWAAVLAASQRDGVDIPAEGPLTLQQLVLKSLLAQGFTEQSFARVSGVPYPTLMGLTRKGAIPRTDTLGVIADKLGIPREDLEAAVEVSRARRDAEELEAAAEGEDHEPSDDESGGAPALTEPPGGAPAASSPANGAETEEIPHLAQVVADSIASHGVSVAAFGRQHGIPYLSLNRLISQGVPPRRKSVLEPLARALGLSDEVFETSLQKSKRSPTPATAPKDEDPLTPLQEALQRVVRARNLTTKAFAELADLSVLTATKLLKHGDLPGRQTTHEKLKNLLQLSEHEYQDIVRRSRQEGEAAPPTRVGEAPAIPVAGASVAAEGPTVAELTELIERLNPRQRAALKQFILTMI
jgi:transcriptional regulator with XRE-family HTH domain